MTYPNRRRIFRTIPGLENAEFVRYGSVHRNTYLHSPHILDSRFRLQSDKRIFFAGQITGWEGYVESAASGLLAESSYPLPLGGRTLPSSPTTALGA